LQLSGFSFGHLSLTGDTTILTEMARKPNDGTFKSASFAVQTFSPSSHTNDIESPRNSSIRLR
jgi:hypothetical protein